MGEEHRGHGCCEDPDGPSDDGVVVVAILREPCMNCAGTDVEQLSICNDDEGTDQKLNLCLVCLSIIGDMTGAYLDANPTLAAEVKERRRVAV